MTTFGLMIRWVARYLSAIVALIVFVIFIGEVAGADNLRLPDLTLTETLMSIFFLVAWLGLIVGWWHERLGGWMVVGGLAAFYLTEFLASGKLPSGPYFLYMFVPGLLYLLSDMINGGQISDEDAAIVPESPADPTTGAHEIGAAGQ
jgi:hypothetical protein